MFDGFIENKEVCLDYKNFLLRFVKNLHLVKKFKFLPKLNLFQNGSNMRSDGGPDKKVFLDFAFSKGLTHNFRQKLEILRNLFLFRKGLGVMFDDVLVKIEVFLEYKIVTIR